jgi:hypothetical protein
MVGGCFPLYAPMRHHLAMSLRSVMDSKTLADTFPDGTVAAAPLVAGWFWPLAVVGLSNYRERVSRKK